MLSLTRVLTLGLLSLAIAACTPPTGLEQGEETPTESEQVGAEDVGVSDISAPIALPPAALPEGTEQPAAEREDALVYVVQPGDTLSEISFRCSVVYQRILDANPGIEPRNLSPGQEVRLPGVSECPPGPDSAPIPLLPPLPPVALPEGTEQPAAEREDALIYVVQPGDTLGEISFRCSVIYQRILDANPGIEPRSLSPGQEVRLPGVSECPGPGSRP
ncbi:MAG: LysM domain-containing protein [Aphanocapsa feldmannii 277cV]|uniref:LysM domain-containing protein n=2 Tax=Aphanocapsa feldmannii TaxID=192050 RepID=A0A524RS01_9CHRO|nr:MAG: LysM domain-containing protein [Aphanocapsa feldmannii 288cV]TGG96827.1 MAG: LysM domain-containing protein [Aphanocapsa feldmannii 277cV]TGH26277.1 MAG: LysM domain-containing protein [Aphanocapsa feldmannii 277cI]